MLEKLKRSYKEKTVKDYSFGTYEGDGKKHSKIITKEVWQEKSVERYSTEDNRWIRKPIKDGVETKLKIYWYADGKNQRIKLNNLYDDYEVDDLFLTTDFSIDYAKYDIEPDVMIFEDKKETRFYKKIFELIHTKEYSYESKIWTCKYKTKEIKKIVSDGELTISHVTIADWIKKDEVL